MTTLKIYVTILHDIRYISFDIPVDFAEVAI